MEKLSIILATIGGKFSTYYHINPPNMETDQYLSYQAIEVQLSARCYPPV